MQAAAGVLREFLGEVADHLRRGHGAHRGQVFFVPGGVHGLKITLESFVILGADPDIVGGLRRSCRAGRAAEHAADPGAQAARQRRALERRVAVGQRGALDGRRAIGRRAGVSGLRTPGRRGRAAVPEEAHRQHDGANDQAGLKKQAEERGETAQAAEHAAAKEHAEQASAEEAAEKTRAEAGPETAWGCRSRSRLRGARRVDAGLRDGTLDGRSRARGCRRRRRSAERASAAAAEAAAAGGPGVGHSYAKREDGHGGKQHAASPGDGVNGHCGSWVTCWGRAPIGRPMDDHIGRGHACCKGGVCGK